MIETNKSKQKKCFADIVAIDMIENQRKFKSFHSVYRFSPVKRTFLSKQYKMSLKFNMQVCDCERLAQFNLDVSAYLLFLLA